jgi:uncharacterized protein YbcV (DUF1398 family)
MDASTQALIRATFDASNRGSLHFGQVLQQLASVQVESYHVDYRAARATYYLLTGIPLDLSMERARDPIADHFDAAAVRAAIAGAQSGQVMYPEFKRLTQRAGCVGYTVWLAGRQVCYLGRRGEVHVERFLD